MNEKQLRKRLGIPPGSTLTALVALAEKVSPRAPWDAFELLWLYLPWLEPGTTVDEMRHGTPRNVHPFAETGGDLHHVGFLMDGDLPTDERPIVYVDPKDDSDATQIVAPNLRAFLGLVAISFVEVVSRRATDDEWFGFREDWYGDDPARLAEMERLSTLLCTIPGVVRPARPASVANAVPDQAFKLVFDDDEDGDEDGDEDVEGSSHDRALDFQSNLHDAHQATSLAQRALDKRQLEDALHHARCGVQHPAYRARCLYLLATIHLRSGEKGAAETTTEELLEAWLDPSPVALPGVHARNVIAREELISLLEQAVGHRARPLIQRVLEAPEIDEPSGDFL